jgi:hypothetical protein
MIDAFEDPRLGNVESTLEAVAPFDEHRPKIYPAFEVRTARFVLTVALRVV